MRPTAPPLRSTHPSDFEREWDARVAAAARTQALRVALADGLDYVARLALRVDEAFDSGVQTSVARLQRRRSRTDDAPAPTAP